MIPCGVRRYSRFRRSCTAPAGHAEDHRQVLNGVLLCSWPRRPCWCGENPAGADLHRGMGEEPCVLSGRPRRPTAPPAPRPVPRARWHAGQSVLIPELDPL